jgi:hypothetical protein
MRSTIIAFDIFLNFFEEAKGGMKDPRGKKSNGTKYKIRDGILTAFSMFFMQSQSLSDTNNWVIIC